MSWKIPKIWKDGECWIIGGGPSVPRQFGVPEDVISQVLKRTSGPEVYSPYLSYLHDKHVIGVNAAYLIGNWMDFIVFGDTKFYLQNRINLLLYPKTIIGCNNNGKGKIQVNEIKHVMRSRKNYGLTLNDPCKITWNGNSGAAAINVACHMGVKKIFLLGFDMNLDNNLSQHWHVHYNSANIKKTNTKKLPFHKHLVGFPQIAKDAKRAGIEIINVSPDSKIKDFIKVSLKDII